MRTVDSSVEYAWACDVPKRWLTCCRRDVVDGDDELMDLVAANKEARALLKERWPYVNWEVRKRSRHVSRVRWEAGPFEFEVYELIGHLYPGAWHVRQRVDWYFDHDPEDGEVVLHEVYPNHRSFLRLDRLEAGTL